MYEQSTTAIVIAPASTPAPDLTPAGQAERALYDLLDQIGRVEALLERHPDYGIQFDALCHLQLSRAGVRHAIADLNGTEA